MAIWPRIDPSCSETESYSYWGSAYCCTLARIVAAILAFDSARETEEEMGVDRGIKGDTVCFAAACLFSTSICVTASVNWLLYYQLIVVFYVLICHCSKTKTDAVSLWVQQVRGKTRDSTHRLKSTRTLGLKNRYFASPDRPTVVSSSFNFWSYSDRATTYITAWNDKF